LDPAPANPIRTVAHRPDDGKNHQRTEREDGPERADLRRVVAHPGKQQREKNRQGDVLHPERELAEIQPEK
jgi:hypothetical protein